MNLVHRKHRNKRQLFFSKKNVDLIRSILTFKSQINAIFQISNCVDHKDVHIVVPFAYLLLSYSKFEWAENTAVQARTKKLSGKQICCTTKWFL